MMRIGGFKRGKQVRQIVILIMKTSLQKVEGFNMTSFFDKTAKGQSEKGKLVLDKPNVEEGNEDSTTCPKLIVPIRVDQDDEATRTKGKNVNKNKKQLQNNNSPKRQRNLFMQTIHKIQVPVNKATEDIFNKTSLRQKYSNLLPSKFRLQLSYQQMRLLKAHKLIDQTLDFFLSQRSIRTIFFQDLRKNVLQSVHSVICLDQIQQLLFLDDSLYGISWQINTNIRKYDILIKIPKITSFEEREAQTRAKLTQFLLAHEAQLIASGSCHKKDPFAWAVGFDPAQIAIPLRPLPVHPNQRNACLSSLSQSRIKAVENPIWQNAIKQQKADSQAKRSLTSQDVANMIFAKRPVHQIREKIYAAVRQREQERKLKETQTVHAQTKLDKKTILRVCEEILLIFMAKGVSNVFKVTLIDLLYKKTHFHPDQINNCLRILLQINNGFIKEVQTSNKTVVIQINKAKTNQTRQAVALL